MDQEWVEIIPSIYLINKNINISVTFFSKDGFLPQLAKGHIQISQK